MVIAKSEWFGRRKYGGWGVTLKTWQGVVYIVLALAILAIFQALPYWDYQTRLIFTGIWLFFLIVDIFDVMIKLNKDEREKIHEAFAERNALWAVIMVLVIGILYQIIISALNQTIKVDWVIIVALLVGLIVKAISNIYLDKKN